MRTPLPYRVVYAFGVGEMPISISGGAGRRIHHTVRDVGAVTHAIVSTSVGGVLGLSGPYGHGWGLDTVNDGDDLVVVAGGIGLAPVLPRSWSSRMSTRHGGAGVRRCWRPWTEPPPGGVARSGW